ncbi:hypothetical protein B296_00001620 [Ensete ventricosum]|uniref:Uncharacterized protein n=1 Tax=Ensete ventricosum TaxID=4639 RepID=A0A427AUA6_ENSVE|nr:hypothetical protein B296_00001620 [Ensete ventricosum]
MSSWRLLAVADWRGTVHRKKRDAVAWQRWWQGTAKAVASGRRDDVGRSVPILLVPSAEEAEERRSWIASSTKVIVGGSRQLHSSSRGPRLRLKKKAAAVVEKERRELSFESTIAYSRLPEEILASWFGPKDVVTVLLQMGTGDPRTLAAVRLGLHRSEPRDGHGGNYQRGPCNYWPDSAGAHSHCSPRLITAVSVHLYDTCKKEKATIHHLFDLLVLFFCDKIYLCNSIF